MKYLKLFEDKNKSDAQYQYDLYALTSKLMNEANPSEASKLMARHIAHYAIRNSELENLHSGTGPSSKKGDYSDVKVVSPYGEIPWNEVSKISDEEMRKLMLDIEDKLSRIIEGLYNIKLPKDILDFYNKAYKYGVSWDKKDFKT